MGKYLIKIKKENEKKRNSPGQNKKKDKMEKPKSDTESISSESSVISTEEPIVHEVPVVAAEKELDFDEQLKLIMNFKKDPKPVKPITKIQSIKTVPVPPPAALPINKDPSRSKPPVSSRGGTVSSRRI